MTAAERTRRLLGHAEAYWRAVAAGDSAGQHRHLWGVLGALKERAEPSTAGADVVEHEPTDDGPAARGPADTGPPRTRPARPTSSMEGRPCPEFSPPS